MANYKDKEAKIGDLVRGTTQNLGGRPIVGTIISLTSGAEHNCQVAFLETLPANEVTGWQSGALFRTANNQLLMLVPKTDYADVRQLEKIHEAAPAPRKAAAAGGAKTGR